MKVISYLSSSFVAIPQESDKAIVSLKKRKLGIIYPVNADNTCADCLNLTVSQSYCFEAKYLWDTEHKTDLLKSTTDLVGNTLWVPWL